MAAALRERLGNGLAKLDLALAEAQVTQLVRYLELIEKWNKIHNLTAVREPGEMLTHHLLDSLAIVNPLRRELDGRPAEVLDVGSGAGLPGVVLAICCPELRVDCVDAVAKKAAFVQQVAAELQLHNLKGLHGRVQDDLQQRYRIVTCRAFASLSDFVSWTDSVLAEEGVWLAMKGKAPTAEIAALAAPVEVFHVEQLQVPGLGAERCIVWMKRRAVT
jgi:16S rRNA (guanine527-N7)-methyltransferase